MTRKKPSPAINRRKDGGPGLPKPATMKDVARKVGVSVNAVSLALRHDAQISDATRRKIVAAAEKLGLPQKSDGGPPDVRAQALALLQGASRF